jgi:hypothetical protein
VEDIHGSLVEQVEFESVAAIYMKSSVFWSVDVQEEHVSSIFRVEE